MKREVNSWGLLEVAIDQRLQRLLAVLNCDSYRAGLLEILDSTVWQVPMAHCLHSNRELIRAWPEFHHAVIDLYPTKEALNQDVIVAIHTIAAEEFTISTRPTSGVHRADDGQ